MKKSLSLLILLVITESVLCWDNIPSIPSNRRSQFYLRNDDGAYKYGYDSGDGIAAKQDSSADNQVEGFYTMQNADGELITVKYTAGVQGFVTEPSNAGGSVQARGRSNTQPNVWKSQSSKTHEVQRQLAPPLHTTSSTKSSLAQNNDDSTANSDASYKISYNTGEHAREENSDASGNVQGRYSYVDEAGQHDLSYIAGPEIGFKVTGGSLAHPNQLPNESGSARTSFSRVSNSQPNPSSSWKSSNTGSAQTWSGSQSAGAVQPNSDGSYSFSYNTGDHSRSESSDASGNVQGKYAYTDDAGHHDLSYVAGADSGFVVTGGSLATPNSPTNGAASTRNSFGSTQGADKSWQSGGSSSFQSAGAAKSWKAPSAQPWSASSSWKSADVLSSQPSNDGSYSFSYDTGDQSRTESSDASGNVQGRYAYTDEAGQHDLSYVAGADSGFIVTGGSLATPNALPSGGAASRTSFAKSSNTNLQSHGAGQSWKSTGASNTQQWQAPRASQPSSDGAYSFSYDSDDQSRTESSDASGNVQGRYSYTDEAGQHDLSYVAGGDSGFVVTGGSLAPPNSLIGNSANTKTGKTSWSQTPINVAGNSNFKGLNQQSSSQDGSAYEFAYQTDGQTRQESSDASGRVKGTYSVQTDGGHQQVTFNAGGGDTSSSGDNSGSSWSSQGGSNGASSWEASSRGSLNVAPVQRTIPQTVIEGKVFEPSPNVRRPYDTGKSVHPTFTIIAPSTNQKSFEYGPENAIILGYLAPEHSQKHGYIYDTQH